jgi:alpha-D-xyloside xylohydrolase
MRLWVNGQLLIEDWKSRPAVTKTATIDLPANQKVPIKIEYFQDTHDALIDLRWQPPADNAPTTFTRKVYLPKGQWYDFWSGQSIAGGQTINAAAPIERMPLLVKAGTILPLGPVVQYASEKPDAPLELRIYRGADGTFTLYDDAGDGYGYEKGEYATTTIHWDDKAGKLTIDPRAGSYPGMTAKRQFDLVVVSPTNGIGPEPTPKADHVLQYDGSTASVVLK